MTSRRLCGASRCCKAKARDGTEMKVRAAGLVLPQAPRWCCAARRRYRPWCLAAPEMRLTNPLMSRGLNGREPPGGEDRGEGQWAYAVRHYSNTLSFLNKLRTGPAFSRKRRRRLNTAPTVFHSHPQWANAQMVFASMILPALNSSRTIFFVTTIVSMTSSGSQAMPRSVSSPALYSVIFSVE